MSDICASCSAPRIVGNPICDRCDYREPHGPHCGHDTFHPALPTAFSFHKDGSVKHAATLQVVAPSYQRWGTCHECGEVLLLREDANFQGKHKTSCPLRAVEDQIHAMAANPNTVIDMEGLDRKGECRDCGCKWISREVNNVCPNCRSTAIEERS